MCFTVYIIILYSSHSIMFHTYSLGKISLEKGMDTLCIIFLHMTIPDYIYHYKMLRTLRSSLPSPDIPLFYIIPYSSVIFETFLLPSGTYQQNLQYPLQYLFSQYFLYLSALESNWNLDTSFPEKFSNSAYFVSLIPLGLVYRWLWMRWKSDSMEFKAGVGRE